MAPVLFTQLNCRDSAAPLDNLPGDIDWVDFQQAAKTAIVLDLSGEKSVRYAMALALQGFRPVPLFNSSPGPAWYAFPDGRTNGPADAVPALSLSPDKLIYSHSAIEMSALIEAFCRATPLLLQTQIPPNAPPVFLLDSIRLRGTLNNLSEGMFDNRWMVVPQDFPSARFLLSHQTKRALVVQEGNLMPLEDLSHVLLRWQEAGIEIYGKSLADEGGPSRIWVKRPSRFKMVWYRALALMGFRRNSAGGFGSFIPTAHGGG